MIGVNVRRATTGRKVYVKMSSLTGKQAQMIIQNKLYCRIVDISEGSCQCSLNREQNDGMDAVLAAVVENEKCQRCTVVDVWETFATDIYPLLMANGVPVDLQDAISGGTKEEFLQGVKVKANDWLISYRSIFGASVTPYIHIVGKHLEQILGTNSNNSVGEWRQVFYMLFYLCACTYVFHSKDSKRVISL